MRVLVIVEHDNAVIHQASLHVLTAAKEYKGEITLLVAGFHCENVAKIAATFASVSRVLCVDDAVYAHFLPENMALLVADIAKNYDVLLMSSSTLGKNLLPRVAALLDVAQVSDVIEIMDSKTVKHPIYAGNALEVVRILDEKVVLTIRVTAFSMAEEKQEACPVECITKNIAFAKSTFVEASTQQLGSPDLSGAKIVVSGGRGLQNKDNFKLIQDLADTLGAALGASRAAVDAGFVANDCQVGQTGKVVAPMLYIAVGISGAIQHLAGMKDSKIIVAINKDADAPMMQIATYSLVGDLFEIVPQLIERLKSL